jgi:hypothetical protein
MGRHLEGKWWDAIYAPRDNSLLAAGGGREGYDRDIEDTLGTAGRELDGHVRRWDMDRVRKPRGQEYRRFGPALATSSKKQGLHFLQARERSHIQGDWQ